MNQVRKYPRKKFREVDSYENRDQSFIQNEEDFIGPNRYGEKDIRHDSYQDAEFQKNYDPTFEDEYGMKHPYEHGGKLNRWSDDIRSEASREGHTGKGPKGFQRSPERIKEEACEILMDDPYLDASEIEVIVQGNILVLRGVTGNRHDKRRAELLVEDILGVRDVHNQISVKRAVSGWIPGVGNVDLNEQGGRHGQGE